MNKFSKRKIVRMLAKNIRSDNMLYMSFSIGGNRVKIKPNRIFPTLNLLDSNALNELYRMMTATKELPSYEEIM